jgi:hypothetical protein
MLELLTETVPPLTQAEHIRANLQALILVASMAAVIIVVALLLNKAYLKKRYATAQAKLVAEGRSNRGSVLAEIANAKPLRFDDTASPVEAERRRGSLFGDNYNPYGDDGGASV